MHPIQSPHLFFVLEESVNALPSSFLVNYSSNFLPQRKWTEDRIACPTFRYFRILYTYIFVEKMKIVKERNACLHGTLEKGFAVENWTVTCFTRFGHSRYSCVFIANNVSCCFSTENERMPAENGAQFQAVLKYSLVGSRTEEEPNCIIMIKKRSLHV